MMGIRRVVIAVRVSVVFAALALIVPAAASAQDTALPDGEDIVRKVNARDDGEALVRTMHIEMTDKRGKTRKQTTIAYRKYYGEEKRSAIFYTEPTKIKGTGFLTYDYPDPAKDDDQWIYLPALRKVRRISASNRGAYFLGTDFTYEDMKLDTRMSQDDYMWTTVREEVVDGHACYVVEGVPVDAATAEELGYSKYVSYIDPEIWMQRQGQMWDTNGNRLKTVSGELQEVQGIWSAMTWRAVNHKTGHSTIFTFENTDYQSGIADDMFTERALMRGARRR